MIRVNKFINDSGYCSRREADRYIEQGRVTVNGIEAKIGSMVQEGDVVEVDGEKVRHTPKKPVYIAFNKPVGVTSTTDTDDKTNIIDFIGYKERIFHVGRLDKDSEGLIILTNDGDIVNKILRAGNNNPKEYIVTVSKPITGEFLKNMSQGVRILGEKTKPCKVIKKNETTFVIHLTQGLNRQIRRMCQALDNKVVRLKRVKVINITLGNLEPGRWRYFTADEVNEMHKLLAESVGTEEASIEKKVSRSKKGSFSDYRKKGGADTGKQTKIKKEYLNFDEEYSLPEAKESQSAPKSATRSSTRPSRAGQGTGYSAKSGPAKKPFGGSKDGGYKSGRSSEAGREVGANKPSGTGRAGGRPSGIGGAGRTQAPKGRVSAPKKTRSR